MNYDLEDRTLILSKWTISICRDLKPNFTTRNTIDQLIRAITSIGANYREANGTISKKDFCSKIHICKKESKEACYWIEVLTDSYPESLMELRGLAKETHELTLIFSRIASRSKN
jgi:four helix bundle protein